MPRTGTLLLSLLLTACTGGDDTDVDPDTDAGTDTDLGTDTDTDTDTDSPLVDLEVSEIGYIPASDNSCAYGDNLSSDCTDDAPEWVVRFTAPTDGIYKADSLDGWPDTTVSLYDEGSPPVELSCDTSVDQGDGSGAFDNPGELELAMAAGESVLIATSQADCQISDLRVRRRNPCIPDDAQDGVILSFDEAFPDLVSSAWPADTSLRADPSIVGQATQVDGIVGDALGAGDCVRIDHDNDLWPVGIADSLQFTWSAWFRADDAPSSGIGVLFELRDCVGACSPDEDTAMFRLSMDTDGAVSWFWRTYDYFGAETVTSQTGLDDGEWHHAVVTYSAETDRVILFIDGAEAGRARVSFNSLTTEPDPEPMTVGCAFETDSASTPARHFVGDLDEVVMVPRQLLEDEVEAWTTCIVPAAE